MEHVVTSHPGYFQWHYITQSPWWLQGVVQCDRRTKTCFYRDSSGGTFLLNPRGAASSLFRHSESCLENPIRADLLWTWQLSQLSVDVEELALPDSIQPMD